MIKTNPYEQDVVMKRFLKSIFILVRTAVVLCLLTSVAQALVIEYPTSEPGKMLRLVLTSAPGGMAMDRHGNIYYSDQGNGIFGNGVIKMIPKETNIPVTILTGLDRPGDIELSLDEQAMIVTEADAKVTKYYFGLAARFQSLSGDSLYNLTLYVNIPGVGLSKGYRQMVDGFYLVPNLLAPGYTSPEIELIVEYPEGDTFRYKVTVGQTNEPEIFGQTVKYLILAR